MLAKKVKRCLISLLLTSALMLNCGCQGAENDPQISDNGTSAPTQESVTDSKDADTMVTGSEPDIAPAETTERDCEPIPDEWISIYSSFSVLSNFRSVINADTSGDDISRVIDSLVNKNVLFYLTRKGETFEIDWDDPITYGDGGITLYPAVSVFFSDVRSIYDLAYSIYDPSADDIYTYDPSADSFYVPYPNGLRLFFTEIDGKMYVNPDCILKTNGPDPFSWSGDVEITDISDNRCEFIWHYPDSEGVIKPDKYYLYYFDKNCTAVYINGAWRLTEVICTEKNFESIPDEWIRIEDVKYALTHFNTIMNTDNSKGDIREIIRSLVHKSILLHYTQLGTTYEIDWDNPITYGEDEITLYPALSVYFSDVKSFYELVSDVCENPEYNSFIYDPSANSVYWKYPNELRLFFTEIDGKMYVNKDCGIWRGGGPEPFTATSYIEITEQTEDMYKITWHYPDVEGLAEPDKYPDYYYWEGHYKVIYSEGEWHLDRKVGY